MSGAGITEFAEAPEGDAPETVRKKMWFGSFKIAQKLSFVVMAAAMFAAMGVGVLSYVYSKHSIEEEIQAELHAVVTSRSNALSRYLDSIKQDLAFQSVSPLVRDAFVDFSVSWEGIGADAGNRLRKLYITDNPHPAGKKEQLDVANDGSDYSEAHRRYHPPFRRFLRERGYYDIFLFDKKGNVIYTVFKELDYGTNIVTGQWKDTDLGVVFRAARDNGKPGYVAFADFKPYAPSNGAPASFISTPIFDNGGKLMGVLAFQMPIDAMNAIMTGEAGLGRTGDTFIVGRDALMRSQSRFSKEQTILKRRVEGAAVQLAMDGKQGVTNGVGLSGREVIRSYKLFDFEGTRWAFIADRTLEEVYAPVIALRDVAALCALGISVTFGVAGFLIVRRFTRPIGAMTLTMTRLAEGDREAEVPSRERSDEIGEMARAVQVFKDSMIKNESLQAEQATADKRRMEEETRRAEEKRQTEQHAEAERRAADEKAAAERRAAMLRLAHEFEANIGGIIRKLSSATNEMETSAQAMSSTAERTSQQSASAASATEQASASVQSVAGAAEELAATVQEVGRQIEESARIARSAVDEVAATNEKVQGLADAASKIGEVVNLINDIASQTNLLALNATIEAVRAGDAGKCFAVVPSEVKSLANQTAKATEEIAGQIRDIQNATGDAVTAIGSIGVTIGKVNDIAATIASAVEEQNAATAEIAGNATQAAAGNQEVSSSVASVSEAAAKTGSAASQVLSSAKELSGEASALKDAVDSFLQTVRAA
jgi:methyl-accepting chemotaxis protein